MFSCGLLAGSAYLVGYLTHDRLTYANLISVISGALSIAALVAVGWLLARRTQAARLAAATRDLSRALAGLIALLLIDWVFQSAAGASDNSVKAQAVIVLAALTWDLMTSGGLTNEASAAFPQLSRLALFGAYVIAVAAGVLLLSPLRATGPLITRQAFTPELYPQLGILILGVPIVAGLAVPAFHSAQTASVASPAASPPALETDDDAAPTAQQSPGQRPSPRRLLSWASVKWVLVAVPLCAFWVFFYIRLNATLAGPGVSMDWSADWAPAGEYAISTPPDWTSFTSSGWDISAVGTSGGVEARRLNTDPGESPSEVMSAAIRSLSNHTSQRAGQLPSGPARYVLGTVRYPGRSLSALKAVAFVNHEGEIYEISVLWYSGDRTAFATTSTDIFRSLYFPS